MGWRALLVLVAIACVGIIAADYDSHGTRSAAASSSAAPRQARQASQPRRPPRMRRHVVLGYSVRHRPITAYELGDPGTPRKAVIVGCIHGNEAAGVAVVRMLSHQGPARGVDLWLIPSINPDGQAADTRQNGDGVDLNRNFPWQWQPLGPRGTQQYAGPHPLSEPESRIAHALIARLRPQVTIWFHQPLGVVDESGGSLRVERRFARLARLPLRRLTRYPGSAASWQNHRIRGSTAFVVELPPGTPTQAEVARWSDASLHVATGR